MRRWGQGWGRAAPTHPARTLLMSIPAGRRWGRCSQAEPGVTPWPRQSSTRSKPICGQPQPFQPKNTPQALPRRPSMLAGGWERNPTLGTGIYYIYFRRSSPALAFIWHFWGDLRVSASVCPLLNKRGLCTDALNRVPNTSIEFLYTVEFPGLEGNRSWKHGAISKVRWTCASSELRAPL